jgi:hypothetical protein|tara:strand:- start:842 stop:1369 length:528 start_codon:yes stop_codon:yes gene_type:complete
MALTVAASPTCEQINIVADYYSASTSAILTFGVVNASGSSVLNITSPNFTVTATSGPITYPLLVSDLSMSNGIFTIVSYIDGAEQDRKSVLLACDIDCCLAKLTNELIDCACDCAKCSTTLAKAQKIMLLLKSSEYSLKQGNTVGTTLQTGYIQDANNKYTKAREVCDNSCGCDC